MTSLNVGPSQLSAAVQADILQIVRSGLLSESHRGPVVMDVLRRSVAATIEAMRLPADTTMLFQASATACMELILRNLVRRSAFHVVQGAFSRRFADMARDLGCAAGRHERAWDELPTPDALDVPVGVELIALAHCETSTGAMWPADALAALRARHRDALLCVDVTSTFGALQTDWSLADVWFGSVQKCVGLPSGLGYALLSPRAMEKARALGPTRRVAAWADVLHMRERLTAGQTVETPNVLAIALLERQMKRLDLARTEADTRAKARHVAQRFGDAAFYICDPAWRSLTAHNLVVDDPAAWIARAAAAGHRLGAGYGPLQARCIRVPTYPSVSLAELSEVLDAAAPS